MTRIALPSLLGLSLQRPLRAIRNAWLRKQEEHYLVCADIEAEKAREANQNVRYYQVKAAIARSNRI